MHITIFYSISFKLSTHTNTIITLPGPAESVSDLVVTNGAIQPAAGHGNN